MALLTDDVFISMPPMPFEYEGRDVVARFCASIFRAGRRFDLVPTRANGQPAFGAYLRAPTGIRHGIGLYRPHPHRRPDLRHDPLRQQRAPMVRAAAIAPEPIANFRGVDVCGSETDTGGCATRPLCPPCSATQRNLALEGR